MRDLKIRVEGHTKSHLVFTPGYCRCGTIKNGVSFAHSNRRNGWEGGWVIAYRDLERMYLAAKRVRERKPLGEQ